MRFAFHRALPAVAAVALLLALAPVASASPDSGVSARAHIDVDLGSITNNPQRNDFVFVRFNVINNGLSGNPQPGTAWVTYTTPSGGMISRRLQNTVVGVNQTKNFRTKEGIPGDAEAGTYTVTVSYESSDRTTVYDSESTTFTLAPASALTASAPASTSASKARAHMEVSLGSITNDPQRCDFVFTRYNVTNNGLSGNPQAGTSFVTYSTPDGGSFTRRLKNTVVGVNQTKNFRTREYIPCDAAAGTYGITVSFESGDRTTVYDSESTSFTLGAMAPMAAEMSAPASALVVATPEAGPNPFSAQTTIRYELAQDADVALSVFDVTGRQVATLVSGRQASGAQSAVFSGADLPAGTYLWRLAIDGAVTSGQVTLAR